MPEVGARRQGNTIARRAAAEVREAVAVVLGRVALSGLDVKTPAKPISGKA
jgi:hypothetical protein